jgi:hypothetical protein
LGGQYLRQLYNHNKEISLLDGFFNYIFNFLIIFFLGILIFILIIQGNFDTIVDMIMVSALLGIVLIIAIGDIIIQEQFILYENSFNPPTKLLNITRVKRMLDYEDIKRIVRTDYIIYVIMKDESHYGFSFNKRQGPKRDKVWKIFNDKCCPDCERVDKLIGNR